MQERRFVESFNAAIEGFIYVMKTERNMRVHFLSAILILLFGIYLNFTATDTMMLCITITLVLAAEMINTGVELLVDMIKAEVHPIARIVKDVAAGAVLITSINAVIVAYLLFSRRVPFRVNETMMRLKHSPWHLTFISIILVLAAVITGKVLSRKGQPLRGGMPSGHAAFAFAMWTVVAFLTHNPVIVGLTFVMAFLIARHRLKDHIHTIPEVVAGSLLGALITILVFQLLR
jgi:diacylglycerol kinase (ATP)